MAFSSSASSTSNYMRLTYPGYFKFSRPCPCFLASFRRSSASGMSCTAYYRNYYAAQIRNSTPAEWKNKVDEFKNKKHEDDEKKALDILNGNFLKVIPRDPPFTNGSKYSINLSKGNSSVSAVKTKNLPNSMIKFSEQEKYFAEVSRISVNGTRATPSMENLESVVTEAGTKTWPVKKDVKTTETEAESKTMNLTGKIKSVVIKAETKEEPVKKKGKRVVTGAKTKGKPVMEKVERVVNEAETEAGPLVEKFKSVVTESDSEIRRNLNSIYKNVLIVDSVSTAEHVVNKLLTSYSHCVHACDTEVAEIDVKEETPIDHGKITCFSIYSGPNADFGDGKSCIWVDILDGGRDVLNVFRPFFEDKSIKKVWHNYSFDNHIISNYKIKVDGFHADTMHMARLWDSSRRLNGGYSLEALTCDPKVMVAAQPMLNKIIGKVSMKTIFGKRKVKKDGSEGKIITIPPVEELQRNDREAWICYSSLDAITTLQLYESLKKKLSDRKWKMNEKVVDGKNMYDFYHNYWRPFGEILVQMEREGMLVDRVFLSEIEKVARKEQEEAVNRFRNWASKYCADAKYMNVGSDTQLRQLFFGGTYNSKDLGSFLEMEKTFKVPNVENVIEEGKKKASKYRNIVLNQIGVEFPVEMYTVSGWPSVSGDALRALAGKVSAEYFILDDPSEADSEEIKTPFLDDIDVKSYGTAYNAFANKNEGIEACHAIASLCEVCSIDSLISNFILPLQQSNISGEEGRIHCSLNINTETGRLSARRPNLQNQPALEKDRYKIRKAFIAAEGNSLIVADYGQLELRILAHLANCKSMLNAFKAGGDFHSRTAMNMYSYIREAVDSEKVILEWHPQPGQEKPPVPLLKDAFASERRKAKMLNFSIAYGKTAVGLSRDWKVSVEEAKETVDLWYSDRKEVLKWQEDRKVDARERGCVYTLLGRPRNFPLMKRDVTRALKNHIERAAINTPVQGSAADVAMCAMLEISRNPRLKQLGWKLLLQVHDEVILEGPKESEEIARQIVVECMSKPFNGQNILNVDLSVDAKCAESWYSAK